MIYCNIIIQLKILRNKVMHSGELEIDDKTLQNVLEKINAMINDTYYSYTHVTEVTKALGILIKVCVYSVYQ